MLHIEKIVCEALPFPCLTIKYLLFYRCVPSQQYPYLNAFVIAF